MNDNISLLWILGQLDYIYYRQYLTNVLLIRFYIHQSYVSRLTNDNYKCSCIGRETERVCVFVYARRTEGKNPEGKKSVNIVVNLKCLTLIITVILRRRP